MIRRTKLGSNKQLETKTQLESKSHLNAKVGLTTHKRLRPRSKKMDKIYREERIPMVEAFLAAHPLCEVRWDGNCSGLAVDVHEKVSRGAGGTFTDSCAVDQYMASCRPCHIAVTNDPKQAHARGLRRWSHESPTTTSS